MPKNGMGPGAKKKPSARRKPVTAPKRTGRTKSMTKTVRPKKGY
jgi:hypothetical protein